eukprot:EG_transcript_26355
MEDDVEVLDASNELPVANEQSKFPRKCNIKVEFYKGNAIWRPTKCPGQNDDTCNVRREGTKPVVVLTLAGPQQWMVQRYRCAVHRCWMRCVDVGSVALEAQEAGATLYPFVYTLGRHLVTWSLLEYMWALANGGRCSAQMLRVQ